MERPRNGTKSALFTEPFREKYALQSNISCSDPCASSLVLIGSSQACTWERAREKVPRGAEETKGTELLVLEAEQI